MISASFTQSTTMPTSRPAARVAPVRMLGFACPALVSTRSPGDDYCRMTTSRLSIIDSPCEQTGAVVR